MADNTILDQLDQRLAHRGPDDRGAQLIQIDPSQRRWLALVHRRLSIIDLSSSGHQPMMDPDHGSWIVLNGEIYNYRDLRSDLISYGHVFRTQSDTEVILKAYAQWGLDCLERLRGMFAFAIWDGHGKRLILALDRMGIKPLYYVQQDGVFAFSSELRALLDARLCSRKIDRTGLETYLAFGAVQAPFTIVEDVHALLPGYCMTVGDDAHIQNHYRYWTPPFHLAASVPNDGPDRAVERVRELLHESVAYHLVSDVPVGVFLSGGIDSSTIVALASRVGATRPFTFSVTFQEKQFSESDYSRLVSQMYKTEHAEIRLREADLLDLLPSALRSMDQPTVNGINVYAVSQAARAAGFKTVLSGQGGDEVFTGYSTYGHVQAFARYRAVLRMIPGTLRHAASSAVMSATGRRELGHKISTLLQSDATTLRVYLVLRMLFLPPARKTLLGGAEAPSLLDGLPMSVTSELQDMAQGLDDVNQVSLFEMRTYLANMLLRDGDFMSMAHGLEVRVPFLDHKLIEFVAQLPGRLKVDSSSPKPLLLRAVGDLLPPPVYQRRKSGFTFPWEHWLRNQLNPVVGSVLEDQEIESVVGVDGNFCRRLWHGYLRGASGHSWSRVWSLYVLAEWCARNGCSRG